MFICQICKETHCFLGKFTQLEIFLHDCWSRRQRQISSLGVGEWSGYPQTVMTSRAPAVLKRRFGRLLLIPNGQMDQRCTTPVFFSKRLNAYILNGTTRVVHVLSHLNDYLVVATDMFFFTFETKSSDRKAIWSMGGFPRFGERRGTVKKNCFGKAQQKNVSQMHALGNFLCDLG